MPSSLSMRESASSNSKTRRGVAPSSGEHQSVRKASSFEFADYLAFLEPRRIVTTHHDGFRTWTLPSLELEQLQEAWQRTILPAVEEKSIPTASVLREAHPKGLAGDTLTVAVRPSAKNAMFSSMLKSPYRLNRCER